MAIPIASWPKDPKEVNGRVNLSEYIVYENINYACDNRNWPDKIDFRVRCIFIIINYASFLK